MHKISDFLVFAGGIILISVLLLGLKVVLVSRQAEEGAFLRSSAMTGFPLPTLRVKPVVPIASEPLVVTASPSLEPGQLPAAVPPTDIPVPILSTPEPTLVSEQSLVVEPTVSLPEPMDLSEQPTFITDLFLPLIANPDPAQAIETGPIYPHGPSAGPVVRLVIPAIRVDRAVVPMGFRKNSGSSLEWNTDALFANDNRTDLVGQMITSVNPGDGGNIVLVGHNYNNGWYANEAVFVNLQKLTPGSTVTVFTENGSQFEYVVQLVKKVPWSKQNTAELQKHQKYLWPTEKEQLTLVTCGGDVLFTWSARIYVVATPVDKLGG